MSLVTQNFYYFDRDTAERLCRVEGMLGKILTNQETFKMSFEDEIARAKAAQEATNAQLDGIKVDVEGLKEQIANFPAAGLTPEQEAALKEIADGAVALAAKAGAVNDMTP